MPTDNMALNLPVVLGTAGPTYATQINAALTTVDAHNHTSGKGLPVPSAGIGINAALPFNGYPATGLALAQLTAQASDPAGGVYPRCLYAKGADLYWLNGGGNVVRLTNGLTINAAGVGGFTGDYATAGAQAVYNSSQLRYTFQNPDASVADLYGRGGNLTQGLTVAGAASLGSATVSGSAALNGAVTGTGTLNLTGTGASSVGGSFAATSLSAPNAAISTAITGASTINLTGTGSSGVGGAFTAQGLLTGNASASITGSVTASTDLNASQSTGVARAVTVLARGTGTPSWAMARGTGNDPTVDWRFQQSSSNNDLTLTRANLAASSTVRVNAPIELQQASTISGYMQMVQGIGQAWGTSGTNQTTVLDGVITSQKFQSSNGVRTCDVDMGFLYTSGGATYAGVAPGRTVFNSTGSVSVRSLRLYVAKFTGSIIGVSAYISGQAIPASNSMTVAYQRNSGTATTLATWTNANGSGVQPFTTLTKNAFAVTAGEVLNLVVTTTYSCTATVTFDLTFELDLR